MKFAFQCELHIIREDQPHFVRQYSVGHGPIHEIDIDRWIDPPLQRPLNANLDTEEELG